LRQRLRPLAAWPAERLLRLFRRGGLHRRLAAIGLDHHEAGVVEELLGVDARLFGMALFAARRFGRGWRRRWLIALLRLLRLFVPSLFRARLELMNAPLLLGE